MDTSELPTAVAEYLSENRTDLLGFTEALVGYDTRNPPGRTADIVEWLEPTLDGPSVSVERFDVDPEKPNLVATLPGRSDRTLCFNGHLDTVPFDEGDWSYGPLGERDGGRIYGRGTTDMKGAVAAMVQVALAYARTGTEPPVTLQFAFVSDEETGGDAGRGTLLETTEFAPGACVVVETTSRNGRYSVSVADRGNIWLTLEASATAAHGSRPMIGENAIDRLTEAIEQLRRDFGRRELSVGPAMDGIIEELNDRGAAFIIAIVAFWINYYNAESGVRDVDDQLPEVAQSLGTKSDLGLTRRVVLPSAAPELFTGFRTAAGQAWMVMVAAEPLGVPGIGKHLWDAVNSLQMHAVIAYMLAIGIPFLLSDRLIKVFETRTLSWR